MVAYHYLIIDCCSM